MKTKDREFNGKNIDLDKLSNVVEQNLSSISNPHNDSGTSKNASSGVKRKLSIAATPVR